MNDQDEYRVEAGLEYQMTAARVVTGGLPDPMDDRTEKAAPPSLDGLRDHEFCVPHGHVEPDVAKWERDQAAALAAPAPLDGLPEIVCLCGSTRFYDAFQAANYDLTMLGKIVLSVGFYPHALAQAGHGEGVGHDSTEKIALDELHKRKIDLADRVYVLNVGGYIGESTRSEIEYAVAHGKPVEYLEAALREGETK